MNQKQNRQTPEPPWWKVIWDAIIVVLVAIGLMTVTTWIVNWLTLPNGNKIRILWKRLIKVGAVFVAIVVFFANLNSVVDLYSKMKHIFGGIQQDNRQTLVRFTNPAKNFDVLILPFRKPHDPENKGWHIEEEIKNRLDEKIEQENLSMQVEFDSNQRVVAGGFEIGRNIGKKFKADMVIWGDLYQLSHDSTKVRIRYALVNSPSSVMGIPSKGMSENAAIMSLAEIQEGYVQAEVDYVIYWVLGWRSYLTTRDYQQALTCFNKLGDAYKDNADQVLFLKGNCYSFMGSHDSGMAMYQKALEINPNYAEVHNNLGVELSESADTLGARKHYERAIELNPNIASAHNNLANLVKHSGDTLKARQHLELALQISPNIAESHNNIALILKHLGDTSNAKRHFERALQLKPNNAEIRGNYASFLEHVGKLADAKFQYARVLKAAPRHALINFNYGNLLLKMNDTLSARKCYEMAIESNPELADAHNALAVLLYKKSELKNSKAHFEKALSINPNLVEAHNNFALLLTSLGNYSAAKSQYEIALQINPYYAEAHHNMAGLLQKLGDLAGAREHYEHAINIKPNLSEAQNDLTVLLFKQHENSTAREHFATLIKIDANKARKLKKVSDSIDSTLLQGFIIPDK